MTERVSVRYDISQARMTSIPTDSALVNFLSLFLSRIENMFASYTIDALRFCGSKIEKEHMDGFQKYKSLSKFTFVICIYIYFPQWFLVCHQVEN